VDAIATALECESHGYKIVMDGGQDTEVLDRPPTWRSPVRLLVALAEYPLRCGVKGRDGTEDAPRNSHRLSSQLDT
jgi:hypothetical protein